MRAETVHVTDHALLRWRQRACKTGEVKVQDIVSAVKSSRIIKKKEPLPYGLPRRCDSVYSFNKGVLFILESLTIDEYRLVTVIADRLTYPTRPPRFANPRLRSRKQKTRTKNKLPHHETQPDTAVAEFELEKAEDGQARPQRDRAKTRLVHVQPALTRLSDLVAEWNDSVQLPVAQDSAA